MAAPKKRSTSTKSPSRKKGPNFSRSSGPDLQEGVVISPERRFGFEIDPPKKSERRGEQENKSFVPPDFDDGSLVIESGGAYASYVDLDGSARDEFHLITKYREMELVPECDSAIEDVVNESIVHEENRASVSIVLDDVKSFAESIKDKVREEFDNVLNLLDYNDQGHNIFRRWYVDGRINFHKIIDEKCPKDGIQELRYIDPRQIKKVKVIERQSDPVSGADIISVIDEYYLYAVRGMFIPTTVQSGSVLQTKIAKDAICYVHSGIISPDCKLVLSHLHKAIKPLNNLRMLEDATVIYRVSRAPERRIFYIDVGTMPKTQAEQYMQKIINNYRNKMVYNSSTGEIRDDRRFQSMLEDYWLPRREGSQGTAIETLPGGQNLGQMEDVEYFQKKFLRALNVPVSRIDSSSAFNLGRAAEVTRDELKFSKFCDRLTKQFSLLFDDLLCTQLTLKGILTKEEWQKAQNEIRYAFTKDSYFSELKNAEMLRERLGLLRELGETDSAIGKYYSIEYVRKNILQQSEDDIKEIDKQIKKEKTVVQEQDIENAEHQAKVQLAQIEAGGMPEGLGGGIGKAGDAKLGSPADKKPKPKEKDEKKTGKKTGKDEGSKPKPKSKALKEAWNIVLGGKTEAHDK